MNLGKILAGVGLLIGIYLFIKNADQTVKVVNTIAGNSINGIKTLQGR